MISFALVDVKNITSNIPRSTFKESDLEHLAEIIIECGGIIKPLVLKPVGVEEYIVVDGHLEYYAAVRAREKYPREGEMVNAFVISPKNEDIVVKQVEILRGSQSLKQQEQSTDKSDLESRLANIELRLEKQVNELRSELKQERQRLDDQLKQIKSQFPKQVTPLDAFNTLSKTELILRLRSAGITGKKAETIYQKIESQRQKKEFESLADIVKDVKGLSDKGMVTIIDSWSRISFH